MSEDEKAETDSAEPTTEPAEPAEPAEPTEPTEEPATKPAGDPAAGRKILGIDLGTTYSCVAHIDDHGNPETILNEDNHPTTPSVVMIEGENNVVVGELAKDHAVDSPDRVLSLVKKQMGKDMSFFVDEKEYSPEEVSALILKKLKQDAEQRLQIDSITDAIITVPAWFGSDEVKATQDAGELAGLTVHEILREPVAAALAFGFRNPTEEQTLLVYDLGGGTFDITLFKVRPAEDGVIPEIEMISTGGNHDLGGANWDKEIVDYVAEEFMGEHGALSDPRDDPSSYQDLCIKAEKSKRALHRRAKDRTNCQHDGKSLVVELDGEKLKELTEVHLDLTEVAIDNLLSDKDYTEDMIDKVILAGGSTKLNMVREMLERKFPGKVDDSLDPDQCVAHGAAWMAHLISSGKQDDGPVTTVMSHAIGIKARDSNDDFKIYPLILKDATLPATGEDTFQANKAGQTRIVVPVFENEARETAEILDPDMSREIGSVVIEGLPPDRPAGQPVRVRVTIDSSTRLSIEAEDLNSGQKIAGEFDIGTGLDDLKKAEAAKRLDAVEVES